MIRYWERAKSYFLSPVDLDNPNSWRWVILAGHIWLLFQLVLSCVYWLERSGSIDTSNYLFEIICEEGFLLANWRFAAGLTQLLPILAVKMGLSLKAVMIAYSINFAILNYLVFLATVYWLRNPIGGLLVTLITAIGVTHVFYWPVSEAFQCMVYCCALYATLQSKLPFNQKLIATGLFGFLTVASHPLAMIVVPFSVAFYGLGKKSLLKERQLLSTMGLAILLPLLFFGIKYISGGKDTDADSAFNLFVSLQGLWDSPGLRTTNNSLFTQFEMLSNCCIVALAGLILKKRWIQIALLLLTLGLYYLMFNVTYKNGTSFLGRENHMLPFALFGLVAGYETIKDLRRYKLLLSLATILLLLSGNRILDHSHWWTARDEWHDSMISNLRSFPEKKYIMNSANVQEGVVPMAWSMYSESLLRSSLAGPDSSLVIYAAKNPTEFVNGAKKQEQQYPRFPGWDYDRVSYLNEDYFRLPATKFRQISHNESSAVDVWNDVTVRFEETDFDTKYLERPIAHLLFELGKGKVQRIGENSPKIFYRFWDDKNTDDILPPIGIPIVMDLEGRTKQVIRIEYPPGNRGEFKIQILISEGKDKSPVAISEAIPFTVK